MSKITVNGQTQELKTEVSLIDLILSNNVSQPSMVSVQINGNFINRDEYETTIIKNGDEIDFLYFMGGGSV